MDPTSGRFFFRSAIFQPTFGTHVRQDKKNSHLIPFNQKFEGSGNAEDGDNPPVRNLHTIEPDISEITRGPDRTGRLFCKWGSVLYPQPLTEGKQTGRTERVPGIFLYRISRYLLSAARIYRELGGARTSEQMRLVQWRVPSAHIACARILSPGDDTRYEWCIWGQDCPQTHKMTNRVGLTGQIGLCLRNGGRIEPHIMPPGAP